MQHAGEAATAGQRARMFGAEQPGTGHQYERLLGFSLAELSAVI